MGREDASVFCRVAEVTPADEVLIPSAGAHLEKDWHRVMATSRMANGFTRLCLVGLNEPVVLDTEGSLHSREAIPA